MVDAMTNIGDYMSQFDLSEVQQRRLGSYCRDIKKNSDKVLFDDRELEVLRRYVIPGMERTLEDIVNYLDRICFNQSKKDYSMAEKQVKEYFLESEKKPFTWNRNFKQAVKHFTEEIVNFSGTQLNIMSDKQFEDLISRAKAHAGFQYIISGYKEKGQNVDGICDEFLKQAKKARKTGTFGIPLLIGFRTQNGDILSDEGGMKAGGEKTKVKTRVILMSSIIFLFLEEHWMGAIDECLHRLYWFTPGKNEFQIHQTIQTAIKKGFTCWFSADFSRYDSTIPSWMINTIYKDILCHIFDNDANFDSQLYNIMVHDLIHKDVVMDDVVVHLDHGNGSGFRSTTNTSCCSTRIAYMTYFYHIGWVEGDDFIMMVCGDDSIILTRKPIDKQDISSYLMHNFGFICHAHKCAQGDVLKQQWPSYLSREWRPNGQWRDPIECVAKLLFPERFRNHKLVSPEVVIWAYCLTFPLGMRQIINVGRFQKENKFVISELQELIRQGRSALPGSINFFRDLKDSELPIRIAA